MAGRISRREALQGMAVSAAGLAGLRRLSAQDAGTSGKSTRATVNVLLDQPIKDAVGKPAVIDPRLHGHFVEHLGGVVYDGIWVGPDSKIPNINGIRKDIVQSLQRIMPPTIRWPGGCFADRYDWRDGIGPRDQRPRRFGRWAESTEPNLFGTHEFVEFCRLVGADPYFTANVGTGTAEQFQRWLEYCNAPAGATSLADERVANGSVDPFRVRLWAVGNENWGCGGTFTPEDYATEYRRFTTWVPNYGVPLYLIACGPSSNDTEWTRRFLKKWSDGQRAPMNGLAPHYYCGTAGTSTEFSHDQWYELLDKANAMERLVLDQWQVLGEFDPARNIKLIVDEWGTWHPVDKRFPPKLELAQVNTMRDALVAGLTLDIFHRHADKIYMANIAQLVNCLQSLYLIEGEKFVETTNYHVFNMYRGHQGGEVVNMAVEAPDVEFERDKKKASLWRLAGSASVKEKTLTVTLVHTHATEPIEATIKLDAGKIARVEGAVLANAKLNAANTFESPKEVVPRGFRLQSAQGSELTLPLQPASVNLVRIALA